MKPVDYNPVLFYPDSGLKKQKRPVTACLSVFQVLRDTFFKHGECRP